MESQQKIVEGVIKMWNSDRGFGFIEVGDFPDVEDFFAHISNCKGDYEPEQGDCVKFKKKMDSNRGNFVAIEVENTGKCIDVEYFSKEYRSDIRKQIKEEEREREDERRERYMDSDEFKKYWSYERKEGYSCRMCGREFNYRGPLTCSCMSSSDDYW